MRRCSGFKIEAGGMSDGHPEGRPSVTDPNEASLPVISEGERGTEKARKEQRASAWRTVCDAPRVECL